MSPSHMILALCFLLSVPNALCWSYVFNGSALDIWSYSNRSNWPAASPQPVTQQDHELLMFYRINRFLGCGNRAFKTTSGFVHIPNGGVEKGARSRTITMWFKAPKTLPSGGSHLGLVSLHPGGAQGTLGCSDQDFYLGIYKSGAFNNPNKHYLVLAGTCAALANGGGVFEYIYHSDDAWFTNTFAGNWHHVAVTFTCYNTGACSLNVVLNGTLHSLSQGNAGVTLMMNTGTLCFHIGHRCQDNSHHLTEFRQFTYYNRPLSNEEIYMDYLGWKASPRIHLNGLTYVMTNSVTGTNTYLNDTFGSNDVYGSRMAGQVDSYSDSFLPDCPQQFKTVDLGGYEVWVPSLLPYKTPTPTPTPTPPPPPPPRPPCPRTALIIGTGGEVSFTSNGIPSGSEARTISFWLKFTEPSPTGVHMGLVTFGSGCGITELALGAWGTRADYPGAPFFLSICDTDELFLGHQGRALYPWWHHMTFTYNPLENRITLMMNGTGFISKPTMNPLNTSTSCFKMGKRCMDGPAGPSYPATLREIAIWNRVLNRSEVIQLHNGQGSTSGLVGYWPGFIDSNGKLIDVTKKNPGTISGNVTSVVDQTICYGLNFSSTQFFVMPPSASAGTIVVASTLSLVFAVSSLI